MCDRKAISETAERQEDGEVKFRNYWNVNEK